MNNSKELTVLAEALADSIINIINESAPKALELNMDKKSHFALVMITLSNVMTDIGYQNLKKSALDDFPAAVANSIRDNINILRDKQKNESN